MSMPLAIPLPKIYQPPSNWGSISSDEESPDNISEHSSSYPPAVYRPPKYFQTGSPVQKRYQYNQYKPLRKCAYVIAIVEPSAFASAGAEKIANGLYILPRTYDGSSTGETCAVIGVNKKLVRDLFEKTSSVYETLKSHSVLKDVPGIQDLSPYKLNSLKCMLKFLYFVYDHELVLFNIEPKGTAQNEHRYPSANICLPGGGMEPRDEYCWFRCASREFTEETGLELPPEGDDMKLISKQKFTFSDRQAMFFWMRSKKLIQPVPSLPTEVQAS